MPLAERNGQRQQEIVPPEVDNNKSNWRVTLVSGAKEIYSSLKQDSKDMLSAAMEKIGQSERVQNATDRVNMHLAEFFGRGAQKQIKGLEGELAELEQKKAGIPKSMEFKQKERENLAKAREALGLEKDMGNEASFQKEIEVMTAQEQDMGNLVDARRGELQSKKKIATEYEKTVERSKKGLDGRLAQKMEINNERVEVIESTVRDSNAKIEQNNVQLAKLEQAEKELASILSNPSGSKSNIESAKEGLAVCRDKKEALLRKNSEHKDIIEERKKEIDKLRDKNGKLQGKRNELFPPPEKEKQKTDSIKVEESKITGVDSLHTGVDEYHRVTMSRVDGGSVVLDGNRLVVTDGDGNASERRGDEIDDEELEAIMGDGGVEDLLNNGAHLDREIIERMQKLQEKRNESRGIDETTEGRKLVFLKANNWEELDELLNRENIINGSDRNYSPQEIRERIDKVRKGELDITYITRSGGLRSAVEKLLIQNKQSGVIEERDDYYDEAMSVEEAKREIKGIEEALKLASGDKAKELEKRGSELEALIHKKEKFSSTKDLKEIEGGGYTLQDIVNYWDGFVDKKVDPKDKGKLFIQLDKSKDIPGSIVTKSEIIKELKKRVAARLRLGVKKIPKNIVYKMYDFVEDLNSSV